MQIYQELKLTNGTLRGYLHKPKTNKAVPLVVMYHGFTGNKMENNFLFVQFSRFLSEHNIASLRFDFLGSGESDEDFSYMTFSKELAEANAVLDHAKTLAGFNEIIVMGLSMGGALATQVAKLRKDEINKMLLWAPAGHMSEAVKQQQTQMPTMSNGNFDLGGIELSTDFANDLIKIDLWEGIDIFDKPVSLHHGTSDQAVPLAISQRYQQTYPMSELHTYNEANHTFTNIEIRKQLFLNSLEFIQSLYKGKES